MSSPNPVLRLRQNVTDQPNRRHPARLGLLCEYARPPRFPPIQPRPLPRLPPAGPRRTAQERWPARAPRARRRATFAPRQVHPPFAIVLRVAGRLLGPAPWPPRDARRRDVHVVRLYAPRVAPALRHQAG